MKNSFFLVVLCFYAMNAFAQTRRIPDLSLSPAETAQQPNISNSFKNDVSRRVEDMNRDPINPPPAIVGTGEQKQSFMEGYCDPNFISIFSNNRKYFGQEECLKRVRDDACDRFKALPPEVKGVLDDAIGCLFTNGNGYAADKDQEIANDSIVCGASYMRRINLLKKYSGDYYANYALLFMPDDVLDTPGRCVNRR